MRDAYGVLFHRFWEGPTGRQLQAKGKDAVIMATYLLSCRHANMIGLYELALVHLERDLPVLRSRPAILAALSAVEWCDYATYDPGSEHVWVHEMARIRLGLERGDVMKADDNRRRAALRLYAALAPNPFLTPFFDRYREMLGLSVVRVGPPREPLDCVKRKQFEPPSKPLVRGRKTLEAPRDQYSTGSVTGTGTERTAAAPLDPPDVNVITALVTKTVLPRFGSTALFSDLSEETKTECARLKLAYDSDSVRKAVESALHRASRNGGPSV